MDRSTGYLEVMRGALGFMAQGFELPFALFSSAPFAVTAVGCLVASEKVGQLWNPSCFVYSPNTPYAVSRVAGADHQALAAAGRYEFKLAYPVTVYTSGGDILHYALSSDLGDIPVMVIHYEYEKGNPPIITLA